MRYLLNSPSEAWSGIHEWEKHVYQKLQFSSFSSDFTMSNVKTIGGVRSLKRLNFMIKDTFYGRG